MIYWKKGNNGRLFIPGDDSPALAESAAIECGLFSRDDEDECFYEEPISCYNCRYRRWTSISFECVNTKRVIL